MKFSLLKYFRIAWVMQKLNTRNIMRVVSTNAVWGHLSENYLTQKFIARNIFDTKYSRFTVLWLLAYHGLMVF